MRFQLRLTAGGGVFWLAQGHLRLGGNLPAAAALVWLPLLWACAEPKLQSLPSKPAHFPGPCPNWCLHRSQQSLHHWYLHRTTSIDYKRLIRIYHKTIDLMYILILLQYVLSAWGFAWNAVLQENPKSIRRAPGSSFRSIPDNKPFKRDQVMTLQSYTLLGGLPKLLYFHTCCSLFFESALGYKSLHFPFQELRLCAFAGP